MNVLVNQQYLNLKRGCIIIILKDNLFYNNQY
ncbi:hypothetical protein QFZ20_002722 [Flavobacterium sp. W4I14]|nr:hypothetical protein [Flavobacterium sp. W4I14]